VNRDPQIAGPIRLLRPVRQTAPLVFAAAHSGRDYPADFVAAARLDFPALRRSEDSFVDELFEAAPSLGAPLVVARFPRAFCDANREKWELDPAMFQGCLPAWVNSTSARVGAGLGTIARVVASGETIYRDKLDFTEAQLRIEQCWQPFHDALRGEIAATRAAFGQCLLVDCHSMPSSVRRNDPYAGGYITRHYGRPREGVHALQIEICRSLYMDEPRIERLGCFAEVQSHFAALIADLMAERGFLPDI
jgi:N-formylglutamate deformylase